MVFAAKVGRCFGFLLLILAAGFLVGAAVILGGYNQTVTEVVETEAVRLVFPSNPWPDIRLCIAYAILSSALGTILLMYAKIVAARANGEKRVAGALERLFRTALTAGK